MSNYKLVDMTKVKRYSIRERFSKVKFNQLAKSGKVDMNGFWNCLPDVLKASEMKDLIHRCRYAQMNKKAIVVALGGHVVKCGLTPLLIELMEAQMVTCFAVNGSVIIHDYEMAMYGNTSEDVAASLEDGSFGMAEETGDGINQITDIAYEQGLGLGEAIGKYLDENAPYKEYSLLANAYKHGIPVTVHVAIGTDIVHQHPSANGKAIGETSMRDFQILTYQLQNLNQGGVFLNFGSAVIIPEVFLKALNVCRNLKHEVKDFTTAVFDMNYQYRNIENVVNRPILAGGKGYYFIGHHELMLPLFIKSLL